MEPKRPRQASLRRAISAAYYALFHFLIDRATHFMISGNARASLRNQLSRCFEHGQMKTAAQAFAKEQGPWVGVSAGPVPANLKSIATAFVDLQQAPMRNATTRPCARAQTWPLEAGSPSWKTS